MPALLLAAVVAALAVADGHLVVGQGLVDVLHG